MMQLALAMVLAAPPDASISVAVPGGGPVTSLTLASRTFAHTMILPGPIGGPVAGAQLVATLDPGGRKLVVEGALYSQGTFRATDEPYASLKRGALAALAAPDGSRVAYSYDGGKTWRLLFLSPVIACRHHTWPSAALALATPAEKEVQALLTTAHPGQPPEGIDEFDHAGDDADAAFSWAMAHVTPPLAAAADAFLASSSDASRWTMDDVAPEVTAALPELRRAMTADPALKRRMLDAVGRQPPPERAPSLLAFITEVAPVMLGRFDAPDGGTVQVYGRTHDGGVTLVATATTTASQFALYGLAPGTYRLVFTAPGARPGMQEVNLPRFDYWYTPQPALTVTGDVVAADGGPLGGAEIHGVELSPLPGRAPVETHGRSDERGHFELRDWTGQDLHLYVTPKGQTDCFELHAGNREHRPMKLQAPARLRYRVYHQSNAAMAPSVGVEVALWPDEPFGWPHPRCAERRAVTDSSGTIDVEGSAAESSWYRLRVSYRGARARADGGTVLLFGGPGDPIQFPLTNSFGAPCCR